uniref:Putative secreted protein n=1 Tax=Amblyomma americanum TaxID=6943 RepID=A0A0C9SDH7_AMBAM
MANLASQGLLALGIVLCALLLEVGAQQGNKAFGNEVLSNYWWPHGGGCPPNQTACVRRVCCERKCGRNGPKMICSSGKWNNGCICKPRFYRNQRNKCVEKNRCKRRPWNLDDYNYVIPKRRLGYAGF